MPPNGYLNGPREAAVYEIGESGVFVRSFWRLLTSAYNDPPGTPKAFPDSNFKMSGYDPRPNDSWEAVIVRAAGYMAATESAESATDVSKVRKFSGLAACLPVADAWDALTPGRSRTLFDAEAYEVTDYVAAYLNGVSLRVNKPGWNWIYAQKIGSRDTPITTGIPTPGGNYDTIAPPQQEVFAADSSNTANYSKSYSQWPAGSEITPWVIDSKSGTTASQSLNYVRVVDWRGSMYVPQGSGFVSFHAPIEIVDSDNIDSGRVLTHEVYLTALNLSDIFPFLSLSW